jgi:hypothetical protein
MSDSYAPWQNPSTPPAVPAPAPAEVEQSDGSDAADNFDRDRVLRLLDQLEHDITAVEAAMVHAESGDQEAFTAAVATLEPQLAD